MTKPPVSPSQAPTFATHGEHRPIVPNGGGRENPSRGHGAHIGVFDSGLGGLSVLRALRERLPDAQLTYVADSGHAPYGEREGDFIVERSQAICDFLLTRSVDAIVVACNTATAAAIHLLRQKHPTVPIIGVEPGVKPAVTMSARKRVGVLATPNTLASSKYKLLIDTHGKDAMIIAQPCPGLAKEIEQGRLDSPALHALIECFVQPLKDAGVDTVVLGCTHYPFALPLLQAALGEQVTVIDTARAVAEQTARLCANTEAVANTIDAGCSATPGRIQLFTTGDPQHLHDVASQWLGIDADTTKLA